MTQPDRLLRDTERYLSALHGSVARHDNLAANLGCAGCELRDRIGAVLRASSAGVAPATDRPVLRDRAAAALHAHDYPDRAWPPEREGMADAYRRQAAAVLAVLPTSVDRADVLRDYVNRTTVRLSAACPDHGPVGSWLRTCHCGAIKEMWLAFRERTAATPPAVGAQQPKEARP